MKELKKRFWSFVWRIGWVALSMTLVFLTDNLDLISETFNFGTLGGIVMGHILAEASKAVRNKMVK